MQIGCEKYQERHPPSVGAASPRLGRARSSRFERSNLGAFFSSGGDYKAKAAATHDGSEYIHLHQNPQAVSSSSWRLH
jgi:hypothetical protein